MKKFTLTALAVLVCAGVNAQQASQWSGNSHWYQVVKEPSGISWENARDRAKEMGGYLATPVTSAENTFIKSLLVSDAQIWFHKGVGPWLGGYQEQVKESMGSEGQHWKWVSGETFSDTAWKAGQPDNGFMGGAEGYLHYLSDDITSEASIGWNDAKNQPDAYTPVAFVVEYDTDPAFSHQKDWVDVPFSDTANFDARCEYRIFHVGGQFAQQPVSVGPTKLLFDVSTAQHAFGVINSTSKSQQSYVSEGNVAGNQWGTWNIQKMQKRC